MVKVEHVPINIRMPSDKLRIVAMQPFIKLHSETEEPFVWSVEAEDMQLVAIRKTLVIAHDSFDGHVANFTLFPEYSVPGIRGATVINEIISADTWPNESIIIAGLHGIPQPEYRDLCAMLNAQVSQSNSPDSIPEDKWVNCCVTWVKDLNGELQRWVQPKIRPAWLELNVSGKDMFQGSSVNVFECRYEPSGVPCRFFTLLCYDWVASGPGDEVWKEVLSQLDDEWKPNPASLHWAFVLQHNPKPNSPAFLNNTYGFLTDRHMFPFVEREQAVVIHTNTAASTRPVRSGDGGFTACVFSPNIRFDCRSYRPTVCMQPKSLRGSDILQGCHDVVFRESGECIHAFAIRVPKFVTPDATDRTYPLPFANVHPVGDSDDPRLCGGSVPGETKWLGDSLDVVALLSNTSLLGRPLGPKSMAIETELIEKIRFINGNSTKTLVNWAACSKSGEDEIRDINRRKNSDLWNQSENDALEHVVHSLTSIGLVYKIDIDSSELHALVMDNEPIVQIVAIRGETFQDCVKHYDEHIRHSITNAVVVILRDRDNNTIDSYDYRNILDPDSVRSAIFKDYHTIITYCREAENSDLLKGNFDDFFPKYDRPII
jgi:hypothetical protein